HRHRRRPHGRDADKCSLIAHVVCVGGCRRRRAAHAGSRLRRSRMTKDDVRQQINEIGIIPAIRVSSAEDALLAAEAVAAGGIPIVEVTMTVPGAIEVIASLAKRNSGLIVGAGTIWDLETARLCLQAGAMFLTSPGFDPALVEFARQQETVVFPGALTPTEVMAAWKVGS